MEAHDYEHHRNLTLMFFLDKLIDKGGPRTLHDLSCQFGTRGFSKEMRQIAGGSQSGLRKFLQQYPSLFTVDGEWVTVATTKQTGGKDKNGQADRDYVAEAVEYFKHKLRQYGPGTEVPIKSLLGHRSQAPPEVRHISGQHVKEFRDFLAKYPDDFVVKEEIVFLKEYEGNITNTFCEMEEVKIDPMVTNQFIQFFRERIDSNGEIHVDQLFNQGVAEFSEESCRILFKTPQDLSTFLKIYSHIFQVHKGMVTLVPQKAFQSIYINQNNKTYNHNDQESSPYTSGPSTGANSPVPVHHNSVSSRDSPRDNLGLSQQTLKQRVNMVVMRMIAQNSDQDQKQGTMLPEPTAPRQTSVTPSSLTHESREALKLRTLQVSRVVVNIRECQMLVEDVLQSGQPIGLDGEGVNLGPKGKLTLVQISTMSGQVFIFDVQTNPGLFIQGRLADLLQSENIVKVIHDCRNDSAALYFQHGITLKNVFDTQAAHAVVQLQETGKPVYKVKNVSFNALCELYNAPVNPMKDQVKNIYRRDQKFWARRPLSKDMICYAAADVMALVPTIYTAMARDLKPDYQNLFLSLCEEQVLMYIQFEEIKEKKRQRKVENEVADLKLKLATAQSRNIVLSNREIRLLRYLELTEDDKDKLIKGSTKVAKKLEKLMSKASAADDSDEDDCDADDYPSMESEVSLASPDTSLAPRPTSLTESMQMVEDILSDSSMERMDRIDRLESILAAATQHALTPTSAPSPQGTNLNHVLLGMDSGGGGGSMGVTKVDAETQTMSTGDIVITKVYFPETQTSQDSTPQNSPKKEVKS